MRLTRRESLLAGAAAVTHPWQVRSTLAASPVRCVALARVAGTRGRWTALASSTALEADLVAVQWSGAAHAIRLRRGPNAPWMVLGADHGDRPAGTRQHTSEPVWIRGARDVEIQISGRAAHVQALLLESRAHPLERARPRNRTLSGGRAAQPAIVPRSGWSADESIRASVPRYAPSLRFAVVHHTAGTNQYSPAETAAIIRGIYHYHVLGNGWNDIGYNFLVDRYGQIFEGRAGGVDRAVVGAHALGFNFGSVGIALIGDYASATPTSLQLEALQALLVWRLDFDHVDPAATINAPSAGNPEYATGTLVPLPVICGHRQTGYTDCPGASFFPELSRVRDTVAAAPLLRIYGPLAFVPDANAMQGPARFTARLSSSASWRVRILDPSDTLVWEAAGNGTAIDARWNGLTPSGLPAAPASLLSWRLDAGPTLSEALPATGRLLDALRERQGLGNLGAEPLVLVPSAEGSLTSSSVRWRQEVAALVTVVVLDATGQAIVPLASQVSYAAGDHVLTWAGTDSLGALAPSGHYAYSITIEPAGSPATQLSYPVDVRRAAADLTVTPLVSPNGDGRLDRAMIRFTRLEASPIEIAVLRGARRVARVAQTSDGALGPTTIPWEASGLRDGSYILQLLASTPGGLLELRAPMRISTQAPTLKVRAIRYTPVHIYLLLSVSTTIVWSARVGGKRIARGRMPAGDHALRLQRSKLRGHHRVTLMASNNAGTRARPLTVRMPPG